MIRIPEYDYQVKLRDAPDVRQSFRTEASMFGGNQAKVMKAWGGALDDAGDAFGTAAENEKKKQEKQEEESVSLLTGGSGNTNLEGGSATDGPYGTEDTGEPRAETLRQSPRPDGDPEPTSPAAPVLKHTASVGSTFDRPDLPVHGLTELREAQTDLTGKFGRWLKDVFGGKITPDEARANLRDEVKNHTIGMKSSEAIDALLGWESRQHRHLDAAGQNGRTDQEKLSAFTDKRTEQRHQDVADSGGDMAVFVPQATRLVRDIWQDGRALGLSGDEIDAKVRAELARLSSTAILAMTASDPAQALHNLGALKAKNFIDAETAKSIEATLGGKSAAEAPSAAAALVASPPAAPAEAEAEAAPSAMRMPEHLKGKFRGPSSTQLGSSDNAPAGDDPARTSQDGEDHPADAGLDDTAFNLNGDEDDGLDAAELGAPAIWPAGEAEARHRASGDGAAPGPAGGEVGGRAFAFSGPSEEMRRRLEELGERLAAHPDPTNVPPEVAKEIGLAVAGFVPGIGEAISAKDAYDAFLLARAAAKDGKLGDTLLHGSDAALSAIGAIPLVGNVARFSKGSYKIARALHKVWGEPVRLGSRLEHTPGPNEHQLRRLDNISDEQRLAQLKPRNRFQGPDAFARKTPEEALSETHWPPRGPEENVYRGLAAVDMAIKDALAGGKGIVRNAMLRSDLPRGVKSISLHWGKPGDVERNYRGGFGLSKIMAKHGLEGMETVLEGVAKGKVSTLADPNTLLVKHRDSEIILTLLKEGKKKGHKETWVVTGFKIADPEAFFDLSKLRGPVYFHGKNAVPR